METISNLATAASNTAAAASTTVTKAIWGDSTTEGEKATNETAGTEPVSGETGDVKSGEPYDKGNLDSTPKTGTLNDYSDMKNTLPTETSNLAVTNPSTSADKTDLSTSDSAAAPSAASHTATAPVAGSGVSTDAKDIAATKKETTEADKVDTSASAAEPLADGSVGGVSGTGPPATGRSEAETTGEAPALATNTPSKKENISSPNTPDSATKEKKSLKDKIKEKLHIDKHKEKNSPK